MKNIFGLILVVFIFSGCANQRLNNLARQNINSLELDYEIQRLHIEDMREKVSPYSINIPWITLPGMRIVNWPILEEQHLNVVRSEVNRNFTGNDKKLVLKVFIEEAYKEFSTTMTGEIESVYVKVKIEASEGEITHKYSSTVTYQLSYMDAKKKRLEMLYQVALKNCVYECISNLKNVD